MSINEIRVRMITIHETLMRGYFDESVASFEKSIFLELATTVRCDINGCIIDTIDNFVCYKEYTAKLLTNKLGHSNWYTARINSL
jgi:hypothetical protein